MHRQCCQILKVLCGAMRIDMPASAQTPQRAGDFDVEKMGSNQRVAGLRQIPPENPGQRAADEQFYHYRRVQNDHRESRNSRMTCAALFLVGMGFDCCVRSSHSRIVGRCTNCANSAFR